MPIVLYYVTLKNQQIFPRSSNLNLNKNIEFILNKVGKDGL